MSLSQFEFGYECDAFLVLSDERFRFTRDGRISPKSSDIVETDLERQAINYLCAEWDYAFDDS